MVGLCSSPGSGGSCEAHVSTQSAAAEEDARLPRADGDEGRPQGPQAAAGQGPPAADRLGWAPPPRAGSAYREASGCGTAGNSSGCSAVARGSSDPASSCCGSLAPGRGRLRSRRAGDWVGASGATGPGGGSGKPTATKRGCSRRAACGSASWRGRGRSGWPSPSWRARWLKPFGRRPAGRRREDRAERPRPRGGGADPRVPAGGVAAAPRVLPILALVLRVRPAGHHAAGCPPRRGGGPRPAAPLSAAVTWRD